MSLTSTETHLNQRRFIGGNREWVVYAIYHPISLDVVYVGVTSNFKNRKQKHSSPTSFNNCPLAAWVKTLKALGHRPKFDVLEEGIQSPITASERERYWYLRFRDAGAKLLNKASPGSGKFLRPMSMRMSGESFVGARVTKSVSERLRSESSAIGQSVAVYAGRLIALALQPQ